MAVAAYLPFHGLPRRVAHVKNVDGFLEGCIENPITIPTHHHLSDIRVICPLRCFRVLGDKPDRRVDRLQHILGAAPTSLLKVVSYAIDIGPRPQAVSNLHMTPLRFQKASISLSETNSPRRLCSRPS